MEADTNTRCGSLRARRRQGHDRLVVFRVCEKASEHALQPPGAPRGLGLDSRRRQCGLRRPCRWEAAVTAIEVQDLTKRFGAVLRWTG